MDIGLRDVEKKKKKNPGSNSSFSYYSNVSLPSWLVVFANRNVDYLVRLHYPVLYGGGNLADVFRFSPRFHLEVGRRQILKCAMSH